VFAGVEAGIANILIWIGWLIGMIPVPDTGTRSLGNFSSIVYALTKRCGVLRFGFFSQIYMHYVLRNAYIFAISIYPLPT